MGSYRHPGSKGEPFEEQVSLSVDRMLGNMNKVIQETTIELYSEAVMKTPIKETDAINSWSVSVNGVVASKLIAGVKSLTEKENIANTIRLRLADTKLEDNYALINDIYYILLLENGGYDGIPLHDYDPYPPWYPASEYPRPFTLLTSGRGGPISKKAPNGMVKETMTGASNVFNIMARNYGGK